MNLILLTVMGAGIYLPIIALSSDERIIIDTYTPSKEFCRALVNPDVYIPGLYQTERDITCVLMGFRNVITMNENFFNRMMGPKSSGNEAFDALKRVLKQKLDSKEVHTLKSDTELFLYRDEGKENAELLVKEVGQRVENPYLYGFLLGYRPDDIDFFYKINAFQGEHNSKLPHSGEFYFWPQELKTKFKDFVRNVWPKSAACKKYQQDKKNAQGWLRKQKGSRSLSIY